MGHGRIPLLSLLALFVTVGSVAAAEPRIDGVWGIVGPDGQPKCSGTAVLVFHQGTYLRALPKHGTLSGERVLEMGRSTYRISGDRVEVDQVLTWSAPEPRRTYLIKRGGMPELVREGETQIILKLCPSLDPKQLIQ
ncbi:RNA-binding protein [Nisaea nitritireducens]|uniref:hypothetical protein n=1 Tax=Nisaea nitritireducens TaxID=568392 RepID=UPI0018673351|nr:hypothetical protein [Nisaea nitritireducens]